MLVRSTLRLKLGAQLRALDSSAECPLALRPISVAFFLGALEAFGSAFGVRGNRVQLRGGCSPRPRLVARGVGADVAAESELRNGGSRTTARASFPPERRPAAGNFLPPGPSKNQTASKPHRPR